jgi:uncharacterized membrane protein
MASSLSQKLYACDELKSMGLGFNNLRLLINTIKEIAAEKRISYKVAIEQFFESLEQKYDIKLRQNIQEEKQQSQKYNNDGPDNPNQTIPYYRNNIPSTALPKPSASLEKQRQQEQEMPRPSSISYISRKTATVIPKTTKEDHNNQLNNNYQPDEWYESDYDDNLL